MFANTVSHCSPRTALVCAFALMLAGVLAPAGSTAQDAGQSPRPAFVLEPTGDALFDTYAEAVAQRFADAAADPVASLRAGIEPCVLPLATVEAWNDRFGGDPSYWQLVYICGIASASERAEREALAQYPVGADDAGRPIEEARNARAEELRMAYLRQCYPDFRQVITMLPPDADSYVLLYNIERQSHSAWLDQQSATDVAFAAKHLTPEQTEELRRELLVAHDEQLMKNELADLTTAISAAPQQAWPYYERAMLHFSNGDMDLAIADLERGNAAPELHYPMFFPYSFLYERLDRGEYSGSPELTSALLISSMRDDTPNFIRIKEQGKNLQVASAMSGDLQYLNAWQQFSARLGDVLPTSPIYALTGNVMTTMIPGYLLENLAGDLSAEQVHVLRCVRGACLYTRNTYKEFSDDQPTTEELYQGSQAALVVAGQDCTWFDNALEYGEFYCNCLQPVFELLRQVDYESLTMPCGLEEYERYLLEYEQQQASKEQAEE